MQVKAFDPARPVTPARFKDQDGGSIAKMRRSCIQRQFDFEITRQHRQVGILSLLGMATAAEATKTHVTTAAHRISAS
jgi:hypothetical protein